MTKPIKFNGTPIAEMIERYRERGYGIEVDFPNEFVIMMNEETGRRVRIYYAGYIWEYV
jgi:hypothetical protein